MQIVLYFPESDPTTMKKLANKIRALRGGHEMAFLLLSAILLYVVSTIRF